MANADLDVIKDIPGYKVILKAIVKHQIQQLVEQLAAHTDEESIILTASVADGTLSHIGSDSGKSFLEDHEDVKSQFLGFCLKNHHRKKQQEKERERQQEQEKLQQMMYNPRMMQPAGPRQFSPRYSPRHQLRSPGMRHEPYPVSRPVRRPPPINIDPGMAARSVSSDGQVIKLEPDSDDTSNQSAGDVAQSPSQTPSHVKSESAGDDKDDDNQSASSSGTIPNMPAEGLSLDSDLSNIVDQSANETDPNVSSVKLEALTEGEMELEITGVEPGRQPQVSLPQDWGASINMGMGFDATGATGSSADMGGSPAGYNKRKGARLICSYCYKEFGFPSDLKEHVRSHTGEKPFTCKECGRGFSRNSNLTRHMVTHFWNESYDGSLLPKSKHEPGTV